MKRSLDNNDCDDSILKKQKLYDGKARLIKNKNYVKKDNIIDYFTENNEKIKVENKNIK